MKVGLGSLVLGTALAATSLAPTAVQAEGDGKQPPPAYRSDPYAGWSDERMRNELQRRLDVREPNNPSYYDDWTKGRMHAQLETQDEIRSREKGNRETNVDPDTALISIVGLGSLLALSVVGGAELLARASRTNTKEVLQKIRKDPENK